MMTSYIQLVMFLNGHKKDLSNGGIEALKFRWQNDSEGGCVFKKYAVCPVRYERIRTIPPDNSPLQIPPRDNCPQDNSPPRQLPSGQLPRKGKLPPP